MFRGLLGSKWLCQTPVLFERTKNGPDSEPNAACTKEPSKKCSLGILPGCNALKFHLVLKFESLGAKGEPAQRARLDDCRCHVSDLGKNGRGAARALL